MYNMTDALYIVSLLNVKFCTFSKEDFLEGNNNAREYSFVTPSTNEKFLKEKLLMKNNNINL